MQGCDNIKKSLGNLNTILLTSLVTVTFTYLISFIVGAYVYNKNYMGFPYLGTITYYLWVAVPVVTIVPILLIRMLRKKCKKDIFIISIGIGVTYALFSFLIGKIYSGFLYDIPTKYPIYAMINYYYSSVNYVIAGFLFSVSFLVVWKIAKINREKKHVL